MTDPTASPEDSALRPAESDLHPADTADDLTANTPGGDEDLGDDIPADDPDDRPLPGDRLPGDGTVDGGPPPQADAMRTFAVGRETAAAQADLSDERPTPTATPAE